MRDDGPRIAYEGGGVLYLNVTNRCSSDCDFCAKGDDFLLWGYDLRLPREPDAGEVLRAASDPAAYDEVVFCGFGEPTYRADLILQVGAELKKR